MMLQDSWAEQIRANGFKAVTFENLTGGVVAIHSGFKL
jgi:ubiquinone/menaquinone biosynthesis C-methylase UbiE